MWHDSGMDSSMSKSKWVSRQQELFPIQNGTWIDDQHLHPKY